MSRKVQYRSVSVEIATGIVDRKIALPHSNLEFTVPANTLNATVKLGDVGAEAIRLQPGGKTKFCFPMDSPPSAIFITAPGGDAIVVFGSQEVEPSYTPFEFTAAVSFDILGTWPHGFGQILDGGAVHTPYGHHSDGQGAKTFMTARFGGGTDNMQIEDGKMCYEAITAAATLVARAWRVNFPIYTPLTDLQFIGQSVPEFQRVYWDTFYLKATGIPTTDLDTGIRYHFFPDPGGGSILSVNSRGWGLFVADNGGGIPELHYAANRVDALPTPDEDVNLNVLVNVWRRIDHVLLAPTASRRARILIYVDEALRIEREWQVGAGALPDYQGTAGSITCAINTGASVAGMSWRLAEVINRRGQLQFDGSLV